MRYVSMGVLAMVAVFALGCGEDGGSQANFEKSGVGESTGPQSPGFIVVREGEQGDVEYAELEQAPEKNQVQSFLSRQDVQWKPVSESQLLRDQLPQGQNQAYFIPQPQQFKVPQGHQPRMPEGLREKSSAEGLFQYAYYGHRPGYGHYPYRPRYYYPQRYRYGCNQPYGYYWSFRNYCGYNHHYYPYAYQNYSYYNRWYYMPTYYYNYSWYYYTPYFYYNGYNPYYYRGYNFYFYYRWWY